MSLLSVRCYWRKIIKNFRTEKDWETTFNLIGHPYAVFASHRSLFLFFSRNCAPKIELNDIYLRDDIYLPQNCHFVTTRSKGHSQVVINESWFSDLIHLKLYLSHNIHQYYLGNSREREQAMNPIFFPIWLKFGRASERTWHVLRGWVKTL